MTEKSTTRKLRRRLSGLVVSAKSTKTAVVRIDRQVPHPKYGKYFTRSKRFKIHDPKGLAKVGDEVEIEETRPLSKDKRWRFLKTIKTVV
ncbi:MAG: 30S ribosomal protein S17 [Patescibacteria group bacterium]